MLLELSPAAYAEVAKQLEAAGRRLDRDLSGVFVFEKRTLRRHLECECGNCDSDDVSSLTRSLPPCSESCGRKMFVRRYEVIREP